MLQLFQTCKKPNIQDSAAWIDERESFLPGEELDWVWAAGQLLGDFLRSEQVHDDRCESWMLL